MQTKRFASVESLRFFSILAIIFYHYYKHIVQGGFLAVDTFFVISGYFVTASLLKYPAEVGEWKQLMLKFYRRARKLFFPMFFMVFICLAWLLLLRPELLVNVKGNVFSSLFFMNNWHQIWSGSSYFAEMLHPSLFTHLWYVSVYMQLMLIWPFAFCFMQAKLPSRRHQIYVMSGLILLSTGLMAILYTPGEDPTRIYYGTDTRAFTFFIGALLAISALPERLKTSLEDKPWLLVDGLTLALIGLIVWLMKPLTDASSLTYLGGMVVFDGAVALLLATLLMERGLIHRVLSLKPLVWLGERSYPMYLWYYPIFILWHMTAKKQTILTSNAWLQIGIILLLGILTHELLVNKRWTTPIFNPPKGVRIRLFSHTRALFSNKKNWGKQLLFVFFALSYLLGGVALAVAPTEENMSVQEQQAIEQQKKNEELNKKRAEQEAKVEAGYKTYVEQLSDEQKEYLALIDESVAKKAFDTDVTFIGDSLTVGVSDAIYTAFPKAVVDAQIGRQLYNTQPVIAQLQANSQLSDRVVIDLGANGAFTEAQVNELVNQIGKEKDIYFVNTHVDRPWRDQVNALLAEVTKKSDDKLHLIDWYSYYQQNGSSDWLEADSVHLNKMGDQQWIAYVTEQLVKD